MSSDFIYANRQSDYIDSILDTVKQRDGDLLDQLLNATRMHKIIGLDFRDQNEPNLDQALINDQDFLWKLLSQHHWTVCRCLLSHDIDRAFRHQSKKFSCFTAILNIYSNRMNAAAGTSADDDQDTDLIYSSDDPSWLLPVFNRLALELRLLALMGNDETNNDDNESTETTNGNSTIQTYNSQLLQAINTIQRFSSTVKLRKVGIFIIVNQMLKTYYALHKFNLCAYFIPKAERPLKQYMQEETNQRYSSYVLTYRYFLGKHLLFKHDYHSAIQHFNYVFTNCLDANRCRSMKNKQQALLYLVVLNMLFGGTPQMNLLEKYQLYELIDLIEPIRLGSLKMFMDKIHHYEQYLLDTGLFFVIENLKLITIRNLFRIYVYQIDQQQTDKIPLEPTLLFLLNFGFDDEQFTINELIDILNNMIQKGMIKGYISYKHQTLVVSRKDPFPKKFRFTSVLNTS